MLEISVISTIIDIMRDHKKLKAYVLVDQLALRVYEVTRDFPKTEQFGLTSQSRRAIVSAVSNIVEGCARNTEADFLHFLDMAFGSLRETEYQLSLAHRLGYIPKDAYGPLSDQCIEACKVLGALIRSIRKS